MKTDFHIGAPRRRGRPPPPAATQSCDIAPAALAQAGEVPLSRHRRQTADRAPGSTFHSQLRAVSCATRSAVILRSTAYAEAMTCTGCAGSRHRHPQIRTHRASTGNQGHPRTSFGTRPRPTRDCGRRRTPMQTPDSASRRIRPPLGEVRGGLARHLAGLASEPGRAVKAVRSTPCVHVDTDPWALSGRVNLIERQRDR